MELSGVEPENTRDFAIRLINPLALIPDLLLNKPTNKDDKYRYNECDDDLCDDESCRLNKAFKMYLKYS